MSEKRKITVEKLTENWEIKPWQNVRVTETKHITQILALEHEPKNLLNIRRIDNDRYVDLRDGEIFDYNHTENRAQNVAGVKRTIKQIRNIINNNFDGAKNEIWLTCTYAENMTDTKKLYEDDKNFKKRLQYKYGSIDYMTVVEPQARGAWHTHNLIRFNEHKEIFIKNNEVMQPLWGHGWTMTKRLKDIDNIGAYLSAYLSDLDLGGDNDEEYWRIAEGGKKFEIYDKEIEDGNGKKVEKKFAKGARLYLYPVKFNMYRCSRGIVKPETVIETYAEAKNRIGSSTKAAYRKAIGISAEEKPLNKIYYEQYNIKRKNVQETKEET